MPRSFRNLTAYTAMIAASVAAFLVIRAVGEGLPGPGPGPGRGGATFRMAAAAGGVEVLPHVLLAMVLILALARLAGWMFSRIHQPAVIGEVVAGILLGPSLLGRIAPGAEAYVFPNAVIPYVGMLAQVGVILFLFLVGLELNTNLLRQKTHASVAISHASILAPFVLGAGAALGMYERYAGSGAPFTVFALFLGVSLAVTAFPVLARILTDRGMQRSELGVLALTCAAIDDVSAWCLLALLVGVARAEPGRAVVTVVLTAVFIGTMLLVRPLVLRLVRYQEARGPLTQGTIAVVFVALLVSALVTETIGIHALFGAFFLGALIPHDSALARQVRERLEDVVLVFLLPAFFAFTGLRTEIGLVESAADWTACLVIILLASAGKFGGSYIAARLAGLSPKMAASIGILMNTRGLMELIVLNVGLDLGILSPTLFAMLVLMALVTTFTATPVLQWLDRGGPATGK
jgi:Kef-type K+ transport system membrane component KefB